MEPQGPLLCPQQHATRSHPEPNPSSPLSHSISLTPSLTSFFHPRLGLLVFALLQATPFTFLFSLTRATWNSLVFHLICLINPDEQHNICWSQSAILPTIFVTKSYSHTSAILSFGSSQSGRPGLRMTFAWLPDCDCLTVQRLILTWIIPVYR